MRWTALFADLEAQGEALARAELDGEVRDRTRTETGRLALVDRLRPLSGSPVGVHVEGAGALHGALLGTGPDWMLLGEGAGEALVPLAAVLGVTGAGSRAAAPGSEGEVARRLDLRWALRGLARDRSGLRLVLRDGSALSGTLDRVGADHVELAEHAPGEARRPGAVREVRLLPLAALSVLRRV